MRRIGPSHFAAAAPPKGGPGAGIDTTSILRPMLETLLKSVFGSKHEREVKRARPIVDEINRHFEALRPLSDEDLQAKTAEFKGRIAAAVEASTF